MKPRSVIGVAIALFSSVADAAPQPWSFLQSVGGLIVGDAVKVGDQWSLPIQADVSGLTTFTTRPTQLNSALVCSRVEVGIEGQRISLTVYAGLAGSGRSARCPDALLGSLVAGTYVVFYRGPHAELVKLREVTIGP